LILFILIKKNFEKEEFFIFLFFYFHSLFNEKKQIRSIEHSHILHPFEEQFQ